VQIPGIRIHRRPRFAGRLSLTLALASALALDSACAHAAAPASAWSFFSVSPIQAVSPAAGSLNRYSVTVTNAPLGNAPYARWYLDVKPPASTDLACTDAVLPGGEQVAQNRYLWKNLGTAFVWYHGAKGAYAAHRAYGCVQSQIGRNGYPGTVTVVLENDSQHCTATFVGTARGARPEYGPQPVCALGGYIPLPVPRPLLQIYAKADTELTALIQQLQKGTVTGRSGALGRALDAILQSQTAVLNQLFPPVWGCGFEGVFNQVLQVKRAFAAQIAELAAGRQLPNSTLAEDASYLKAVAGGVRACRPTSTSPIGVPAPVFRAVNRLTAEAVALREPAGRATLDPALETKLRSLAAMFDGLVSRSFPVVFGLRYSDLVDRVLSESSSIELAKRAAQTGNTGAALSALKQVAAHEQAIGSALRKEAKRSDKAASSA
jgi:hypothetical protein